MWQRSSFTLIELLIVVGILAVLVITVLVTLNPAEAQRKTRDVQRMKDLATLDAVLNQYVNDGNAPDTTRARTSADAGKTNSCREGVGWLGLEVCQYISTVPVDPSNGVIRPLAGDYNNNPCPTSIGVVPNPATEQRTIYRIYMTTSGQYEVNVRQESASNCSRLTGDGGNSNYWVEVGTYPTLNLYTN